MSQRTGFERAVQRQLKITSRRPSPPRDVAYNTSTSLLSWRAPQRGSTAFTHFRVRLDADGGEPDFELSNGQTSLVLVSGEKAVVSCYNAVNGLESRQVAAAYTVPSGSGALPSGDCTGLSIQELRRYTEGTQELIELALLGDIPDPVGTFMGVHVYEERPDGSGPLAPRKPVESWSPDDDPVYGEFAPIDRGRHDYSAEVAFLAVFSVPKPTADVTIRVYAPSYSDQIENALVAANLTGPSPSCTFALKANPPQATGAEYCQNVTGFSLTGGSRVTYVWLGGVRYVELRPGFTPPSDSRWSGIKLLVYRKSDMSLLGTRIFKASDAADGLRLPAPSPAEDWVIRALSFSDPASTPDWDDDKTNTYVPNVTPELTVSIGGADGSIDAAKLLASSIAAHLEIKSGVLGVKAEGITADLIGKLAVNTQHLVDQAVGANQIAPFAVTAAKIGLAAIQNAHLDRATVNKIAIVDADIVSLAAAKITAGTLAAGVIYAGEVNVSKLTAGTATFLGSVTFDCQAADLNLRGGQIVINGTGWAGQTKITSTGIETVGGRLMGGVCSVDYMQYTGIAGMSAGTSAATAFMWAGFYRWSNLNSTATASAGAATLPANPVGFVKVQVGGQDFKMPYYGV